MSSITPSGNSPQPPQPPREHTPAWRVAIILLKVIGVLALALLITAGIILGTCLYGTRGFRA